MAASALVVDDEPIVQKLIARILEREGFAVTSAVRVDEAMATLDGTSFDTVFVDVGIPPDGFEPLIEVLKKVEPIPGIVLISGRPLDSAQKDYLDQLGGVFVAKPFGPQALLEAARQAGETR